MDTPRLYGFCLERGSKVRRVWTTTNLSRELYQLGIIEEPKIDLVYEWWPIENLSDDVNDKLNGMPKIDADILKEEM